MHRYKLKLNVDNLDEMKAEDKEAEDKIA